MTAGDSRVTRIDELGICGASGCSVPALHAAQDPGSADARDGFHESGGPHRDILRCARS